MFEVQFMLNVTCHLLFETFSLAQEFECRSVSMAVLEN